MEIDWPELEQCLYWLTAADIERFAAAHRGETFYGFTFDCNSEYGNVLLCLNTPESLRESALEYAARYQPTTVAQEEEKLRWMPGDWKYQGFNSQEFESAWEPFEGEVADSWFEEERDEETSRTATQERFMRTACRVVIRLESAGVFAALNRTDDFKVYVADHDESGEDSWARLEAERKLLK